MRVLYIDIDCLRPDHLGCYGYERGAISPNIDAVAAEGARFTNCHVSDAPCAPSRAALFSGRFGISNGLVSHDGPASRLRFPGSGHHYDADAPMWMRTLQENGWQTVSFSGFAQRHQAWWYGAGFTQNFGNRLAGHTESADDVNALALPWLAANATDDDWFVHVHYFDAHSPYWAPDRHWDRVERMPSTSGPTEAERAEDWEAWYGPRTARDWWHQSAWVNGGPDGTHPSAAPRMPRGNIDSREDYLGFLNGYDAGISYVDEKVGELLAELERAGVRDEVAVVISADHGESIGELGMYFEHGNAAEGTTRVPLIVSWPGAIAPGTTIAGLTYQFDLAATVNELTGIPVPPGWDSTSRVRQLRGDEDGGHHHLVSGTGIYSWQRAVHTDRYRLIRTLHSGLYPYDPVYLFDIAEDPLQRTNLAAERPDVVAELDHLLLEWTLEHTMGPSGAEDPFAEQLRAGFSPDIYCSLEKMERRLEDQGRHDQLADLRRRRPDGGHNTP